MEQARDETVNVVFQLSTGVYSAEDIPLIEGGLVDLRMNGDRFSVQGTVPNLVSLTVNQVELDLYPTVDGYSAKMTMAERTAILANQVVGDDDIAVYPEVPTFPAAEAEELLTAPQIQTEDGRTIEDPSIYAWRDTFPAVLGLQVDWERAPRKRWFTARPRGAAPVLFAALCTEGLKVQAYTGETWQPPSRMNGIPLAWRFGVEAQMEGVGGYAESGSWWTAVIEDGALYQDFLEFEHEDDIDRFSRVSEQAVADGMSRRDANAAALKDQQRYVSEVY